MLYGWGATPRVHNFGGVAMSAAFLGSWSVSKVLEAATYFGGVAVPAAFLGYWSVSKVLEAATWSSNPVFASFFHDLSFSLDGCSSLDHFIAAGFFLTLFILFHFQCL